MSRIVEIVDDIVQGRAGGSGLGGRPLELVELRKMVGEVPIALEL